MTLTLRSLVTFFAISAFAGSAHAQTAEQLQLLQANPGLAQQLDGLGSAPASDIDPAAGVPSAEVSSSPNAEDALNDPKILTQSKASTVSPSSVIQSYYSILTGKSLPVYGASEFQQQQDPSLLFFNTMGKNYRLAAGDILRVTIRGLTESDTTHKIGRDGNLILPNLAPINVSGFTIEDAERRLLETLRLDDAAASVFMSLETARLITVQVSGAVSQPRTLAIPAYTPLSRVLAYAGGVKATGSLRNIVLRDRDGNVETVDFYDFLQSPEGANDPLVTDSSRVFVGNQGLTIATDGFVARPGIYELPTEQDEISIRALLDLSGTQLIPPGAQIEVLYFDESGLSRSRSAAINDMVYAGEALRVRFVNTRNLETVSVRGAVLNEYEFATAHSVALRDVLKNGSVLREDATLDFALIVGKNGTSRALNLRTALLDDTAQISATELLYVFPKGQYSALVQANPNATNDPIVAELSEVEVGEIYLNGRRLAFLAPSTGQSLQDILRPHYRITPQTVTEFAILEEAINGAKATKAISLSDALEKQSTLNITGDTKLFLYEGAFYDRLLSNTAIDISAAENLTNELIARSASVIDDANVLQIFVDDAPFAFLPGETPKSLKEILAILGGLPNDLVEDIVLFEGKAGPRNTRTRSIINDVDQMLQGDGSVSFYSERGIARLINEINQGRDDARTRNFLAQTVNVYLDSRLVSVFAPSLTPQPFADSIEAYYQISPETVLDFALLRETADYTSVSKAISLRELLQDRKPFEMSGGMDLFFFEKRFYKELLNRSRNDIAPLENDVEINISFVGEPLDDANVLQIFVDDAPFAFLPGETPQSLDEILDILGALPTNLAPEFVYYETKTRDNLSGVTSLQKKTPTQFQGDVAISFFTEAGLGSVIAQANLEQSNLSMRERIADATSIYLNDRLVALVDGTNRDVLTQKIRFLTSLNTDIYPLFSTLSKFEIGSALYRTQIIPLRELMFAELPVSNGQRIDLLTLGLISGASKNKDREAAVEDLIGTDGSIEQVDRLPKTIPEQLLINSSRYVGGAVSLPGDYPVSDGVTLDQLLEVAGGFTRNADVTSVSVQNYTTTDGILTKGKETIYDATKMDLTSVRLAGEYVIEVTSKINDALAGTILIQGEVKRPGEYTFAPGDTLHNIIEKAGGLRSIAYPLGAVFTRESLKASQREGNAILANQLEQAVLQVSQSTMEGAAEQVDAVLGYATQLRSQEVSGRLSVNIVLADTSAPVYLEPGDILTIPKRPAHVSVIGSVQKDTIVSYSAGKRLMDYLASAGGINRIADLKNTYILLPNGESIQADKYSVIPPGAVIVVPPKTDRLTVLGLTDLVSRVMGNIATSVLAINNVR